MPFVGHHQHHDVVPIRADDRTHLGTQLIATLSREKAPVVAIWHQPHDVAWNAVNPAEILNLSRRGAEHQPRAVVDEIVVFEA